MSGPPPPSFVPVSVRARRDGWTPDRQRAFIAALHDTRSPTAAAAAVGRSREGAYALCARSGGAGFAAAWNAALAARPGLAIAAERVVPAPVSALPDPPDRATLCACGRTSRS